MSGTPTSPTPAAVPPRWRWTCPLCEASRNTLLTEEKNEGHVANDLRSHIRAAGDPRHGPAGAPPPDLDVESLGDYVERCDG